MSTHLIVGGARSGKSALAEKLAVQHSKRGKQVIYIATAEAGDEEMRQRIQQHQQRRSDTWLLVETPLALSETVQTHAAPNHCLLIDCLTLWLSNQLHHQDGKHWPAAKSALLQALADAPGEILLVSNEVGQGIVPMGELSRRFVDEAGWLNQAVAAQADRVTTVIAGLPLPLKPALSPSDQEERS